MFELDFTQSALDDLRQLRKSEETLILDSVERQLTAEPLVVTKNRKHLRPNELAAWELRIGVLRIFYDVDEVDGIVLIKAVGKKERNRLMIRGREFKL